MQNKFDIAKQQIENIRNGLIADERGNPLRFYHGTTEAFKDFSFSKSGGLYFGTTDTEFANRYAAFGNNSNVRPMYIKSEKPFDFRKLSHRKVFGRIVNENIEKPEFLSGLNTSLLEDIDNPKGKANVLKSLGYRGEWDIIEHPPILKALKEKGFDGVFTREHGSLNFGTFNPENIVSSFEVDAKIKNLEVLKESQEVLSKRMVNKTEGMLKAASFTPGKLKKSMGVMFKAIEIAFKKR